MFHVLGFLHEQSRRDARKYLEFNDPVINANYPAPDLYNYVPFQFPSFILKILARMIMIQFPIMYSPIITPAAPQ